ncbi:MAG: ribosome biogenesis factor YjgA [Pseudomonadota bacterium]
MHEHDEEHDALRPPSRSQRKRDVEALQDLGRDLAQLPKDRLKKMDLPEKLLAALLEYQRLTSHGALRRQMQFIGKVMREIEDVDGIVEQLAVLRGESASAKAEFHALERWRERLLADDGALTDWLSRHPGSDAQQLRQLIRNARKEAELGKPPKSSRELFKVLRDTPA